jgi:hypothetical protein
MLARAARRPETGARGGERLQRVWAFKVCRSAPRASDGL